MAKLTVVLGRRGLMMPKADFSIHIVICSIHIVICSMYYVVYLLPKKDS